MNRLLIVSLLALATTVQADELRIAETGEIIIVEYVGTPSGRSSESVKLSMTGNNAEVPRVRHLTARIEQLRKEVEDILELSGNESEDELTLKNALADENQRQIETYSKEVRRISGTSQPDEEPPNKQQNMSGV
jgi:hypothetical protein